MTTRPVLDPYAIGSCIAGSPPPGELHPNIKAFGHIPTIAQLEAGDIVLTLEPGSKGGDWIRRYQASRFGDFDAQWSHVAVHIRNGILVEALPRKGVVRSHIGDYVGRHRLLVRRIRRIGSAGDSLAISACLMIGRQYDANMFFHFFQYATSAEYRRNTLFRRYMICTEVVDRAFQETFRRNIADCPVDQPLTPAHLSASTEFDDVPMAWVTI